MVVPLKHVRILSKFILSCAYSYPDVQGKMIADNLIYENATIKILCLSNATKLVDIANKIEGRMRSGPNAPALCYRAQSKIRSLKGTIPDKWVGNYSNIPKEVLNIIDNDSRYFDQKTKR
ncbi:MAG: hypothetical protein SRB2_01720 [Desulfobacteraceae bacterium Eth-SRB2]|nr:MAG: hypothetical protein SRB2_01720 [Desulfobacteraceae bacterium Eth-SRB2]